MSSPDLEPAGPVAAEFAAGAAVPSALLAILADPEDHGPLTQIADRPILRNPRTGREYPIVDGIPRLLPAAAAVPQSR